MINKEEMYAIGWLSALNIKSEYEASCREIILSYIDKLKEVNIDNSKTISCIDKENYKLNNRIKELEEINTEHQKLNGELQKKVSYYENLLKGKTIQELGLSDLYKED